MNPYILLVGNHNSDMNIRFKLEGAAETGPRTQFSQFFAGFMVWVNILRFILICIQKHIRKNIFLNLGHFSSFGHIFQPELPKNSGSLIHLK